MVELSLADLRAGLLPLSVGAPKAVAIFGSEANSPASHESVHLDYVSCSPFRMPIARLAAAHPHSAAKPTRRRNGWCRKVWALSRPYHSWLSTQCRKWVDAVYWQKRAGTDG